MNHFKLVSSHCCLIIVLMCISILIACSNNQPQEDGGIEPTLLETEVQALISEHMKNIARSDTLRYLRGVEFPTTSWDGVGIWNVKATSFGGIGCEFTIPESTKLIEEKEGCSLMRVLRGAGGTSS